MTNSFNRNSEKRGFNRYQPNMKRNGKVEESKTTDNRQTEESKPPVQQSRKVNHSQQPQNLSRPDAEQIDNLVNAASRHLNASPEELKQAAQSGNMQKLLSQMTPSQAQQLQKILSDENAAKKLLSTPQAKALLRGLSKNE